MQARNFARTFSIAALVATFGFAHSQTSPTTSGPKVSPQVAKKAIDAFKGSQEGYIENKGQWDSKVSFKGSAKDVNVWLTHRGWIFQKERIVKYPNGSFAFGTAVSAELINVNPNAHMRTFDAKPGITNYLRAKKYVKGVKKFREVLVENVYKNIDVRNYLDGNSPRYDFIVKSGANPKDISIDFKGQSSLSLSKTGSLKLAGPRDSFELKGLAAYQTVSGQKRSVPVRFVQVGKSRIRFALGAYDHTKTLVIDPVIVIYATYFNGDFGFSDVRAVLPDKDGSVFLTGMSSSDLPAVGVGPYQNSAGIDGYVAHLSGDVFTQDFTTFFGSDNDTIPQFLQADQGGNLWVAGVTSSSHFPGVSANRSHRWILRHKDVRGQTSVGTVRIEFAQPNVFPYSALKVTLPVASSTLAWQNAIRAIPELSRVKVTGTPLPRGPMYVELPPDQDLNVFIDTADTAATYKWVSDLQDFEVSFFAGLPASVNPANPVSTVTIRIVGSNGVTAESTTTFPLGTNVLFWQTVNLPGVRARLGSQGPNSVALALGNFYGDTPQIFISGVNASVLPSVVRVKMLTPEDPLNPPLAGQFALRTVDNRVGPTHVLGQTLNSVVAADIITQLTRMFPPALPGPTFQNFDVAPDISLPFFSAATGQALVDGFPRTNVVRISGPSVPNSALRVDSIPISLPPRSPIQPPYPSFLYDHIYPSEIITSD